MAESEPGEGVNPVLQPRLVRLLKRRPKLIEIDAREEVLDELETNIAARRDPDVVAERFSRATIESVKDSFEPVVSDRARKGMKRLNDGALERL